MKEENIDVMFDDLKDPIQKRVLEAYGIERPEELNWDIVPIAEIAVPERHTCCICGREFTGYGNDPWPVKETGRCCDDCNMEVVVPERLKNITK